MRNFFSNILITVLASFYLFPFDFTFLPGINVKMVMAAMGLVIVTKNIISSQKIEVGRRLFSVFCIALLMSFYSYLVISFYGTRDTSYVTYIISMSVWISAAYFLIFIIKIFKGYISVHIFCNYLILAAVVQCILSILIYITPPLKYFVNTYIAAAAFVDTYDRLYGIGCALDSAGTRFSCILIMIAAITDRIVKSKRNNKESNGSNNLFKYIFAFIIIAVIGSIIARTTLVGMSLALIYTIINNRFITHKTMKFFTILSLTLIVFVCFFAYLYNTNSDVKRFLRFGFEGFFSLVETGSWNVKSNNELKDMYRYPDNAKTWIIGDGVLKSYDRYGNTVGLGTYADSDVGYIKFIFYFGIIGLFIFSYYIYHSCKICIVNFPRYMLMFIFFMFANFIIWFKVSTDLFFVFAPFLTFTSYDSDYYENL